MAFNIRDFAVQTYANGTTIWSYKHNKDTRDAILAPGYFNDACDMIATGDVIYVHVRDGGSILYVHAAGDAVVTEMCRSAAPSTP